MSKSQVNTIWRNTPNNNSGTLPASKTNVLPYKNGIYTGIAADAVYGNIQVQTTIQNGKIIDVQFLQYPNSRNRSVTINIQALPSLKQKSIQAQNTHVDIVSSATYSSHAFIQSLQSTLDQAKS